jgi:L-ascorbate metabolism protein UlaG (beta-lactamase superfamily)
VFRGCDTQWHGRFADIGRAYGPFDAVFLPINGARQQDGRFSDLGFPAVLTPSQAAAAAKLLRAELVVPIHYGGADPPTYIEVADPVGDLRRAAETLQMPVRILAVGDSIEVRRAAST